MHSSSRPLLVAGLAASFLAAALAAPLGQTAQAQPQVATAPGQATVSVDIFYAPLAEHGTWVAHPEYEYVFIPSGLDASWRPYQEGKWVWTEAGWYWESGEPFAWATYHYGRWGYEPEYGWFWVPGDTWAPAWVKWREGEGRVGWAPIAPDARGYARGAPRQYDAPVAESWVVVEDRYLTAPDVGLRAQPIADLAVWLNADPREYLPTYEGGVVSTRFIDQRQVARMTGAPVATRQMVYVDTYQSEFIDTGGERLGIYRPAISFGSRIQAPPRYERQVEARQRVVIRQYVGEDLRRGTSPSAALLSVLGIDQRRTLRDARWSGNDQVYQRDLDRFRERESDALQRYRAESLRDARQLEDRRRDSIREREERQRAVIQQREQRADDVIRQLNRDGRLPGPLPTSGAGAPPAAAPGSVPGRPGTQVVPLQGPTGTQPGAPPPDGGRRAPADTPATQPPAVPPPPPAATPGTPPGSPPSPAAQTPARPDARPPTPPAEGRPAPGETRPPRPAPDGTTPPRPPQPDRPAERPPARPAAPPANAPTTAPADRTPANEAPAPRAPAAPPAAAPPPAGGAPAGAPPPDRPRAPPPAAPRTEPQSAPQGEPRAEPRRAPAAERAPAADQRPADRAPQQAPREAPRDTPRDTPRAAPDAPPAPAAPRAAPPTQAAPPQAPRAAPQGEPRGETARPPGAPPAGPQGAPRPNPQGGGGGDGKGQRDPGAPPPQ